VGSPRSTNSTRVVVTICCWRNCQHHRTAQETKLKTSLFLFSPACGLDNSAPAPSPRPVMYTQDELGLSSTNRFSLGSKELQPITKRKSPS
jgi:hypothetical protein